MTATPEQQAILDDVDSRIRVVRAVPGSGKTWLIAEKMRMALGAWVPRHRGIAALSFTNVARDEIHRALGFVPGHPHFIGTLDSFILQYIVKPFAHLSNLGIDSIRLIPADCAEQIAEKQKWTKRHLGIQIGESKHKRAHLFVSSFLHEQDDRPVFSAKLSSFDSSATLIDGPDAEAIFDLKKHVWCNSGYVSHSDITYIARKILRGPQRKSVFRLLEKRFPAFIVDELQDTGWYMGQVLLEILENSNCKAMLVGDPDQAIFEFSGATPALFEGFSALHGARLHTMDTTRRCPRRVRDVAEHLGCSSKKFYGKSEDGDALLAVYDDDGYAALRDFCRDASANGLMLSVLVRRNKDIRQLLGSHQSESKFGSRPLQKLYVATKELRSGNASKALAISGSVVAKIVFDSDYVEDETLLKNGIDPFEWRNLVTVLLFECHREVTDESLYDWCVRQKEYLRAQILNTGWLEMSEGRRRFPNKPKEDLKEFPVWKKREPSGTVLPECSTVHGAKGKTLATVVYFIPKVKADACPSKTWWTEDSEERRVAFVAVTRASRAFMLCVHREVFDRLSEARPEFVARFDVRSLDFDECSDLVTR